MSFADDIKKFGKKVKRNHIKVKRMSAFDLFSSIIISTPVDTGLLRNNWYVEMGQGSPNFNSMTKESFSEGNVKDRAEGKLRSTTIDKDIFFTNNLPYGPRIEFDGWSWRRRQGMVRVNTIRWKKIVSNNAKLVRAGY